MFFNEWQVLVVDDEADVLSVTKLALRDVQVYDLPIKLITAKSKAEAIAILNNELQLDGITQGLLAVGIIDVVMETDHAGLELCNYIRQDLGNNLAQLYIRTGQPGLAPEQHVIDAYDISGYFTKVEATEQKLYTFIKSGVRQWYSMYYANLLADFTRFMIQRSRTKTEMLELLVPQNEAFKYTGNVSGIVFDHDLVVSAFAPELVLELQAELQEQDPYFMTPDGHCLIVDGTRMLVSIAKTDTTAAYAYVAASRIELPDYLLQTHFRHSIAMASLWKRAR